jgi:hypothetical protein
LAFVPRLLWLLRLMTDGPTSLGGGIQCYVVNEMMCCDDPDAPPELHGQVCTQFPFFWYCPYTTKYNYEFGKKQEADEGWLLLSWPSSWVLCAKEIYNCDMSAPDWCRYAEGALVSYFCENFPVPEPGTEDCPPW